jgi:hypothetical protein
MKDRIEAAREIVRIAEEHVRRQNEIVSELARDGHDVSVAVDLLKIMEMTLDTHRETLRLQLQQQQIRHHWLSDLPPRET